VRRHMCIDYISWIKLFPLYGAFCASRISVLADCLNGQIAIKIAAKEDTFKTTEINQGSLDNCQSRVI